MGTYFVHQKRGIAKHHKANESNINPHAGSIAIHAICLPCTVHTTNASITLTHPALRSFWRFSFLDEAYSALYLLPAMKPQGFPRTGYKGKHLIGIYANYIAENVLYCLY